VIAEISHSLGVKVLASNDWRKESKEAKVSKESKDFLGFLDSFGFLGIF
jgi:hypothetical protein